MSVRVLMRNLLLIAVLAVLPACAGLGIKNQPVPESAPPQEDVRIPEDFDEQWKLIVRYHIHALKDTPEEELACYKKTLEGGIALCLNDPYSRYIPREKVEESNEDLRGTFAGVGLHLAVYKDRVVIIKPAPKGPADISGAFKSGDIIVEVNGIDMSRESVSVVVEKIRGKIDTPVAIVVERNGVRQSPVTLIRKEVIIQFVEATDIDDHISYIRVREFSLMTLPQFWDAIFSRIGIPLENGDLLMLWGKRDIILDLRGNPGGLLNVVNAMAALFSTDPDQLIVTLVEREGIEYDSVGDDEDDFMSIPIIPGVFRGLRVVVLVDDESASAAEIFAAYLREVIGAQLVGKKTHGKGSVQTRIYLNHGGMLWLTTAEYFVGNEKTRINGIGITPDYEVDAEPESDDPSLEAALAKLRKDIDLKHDPQLQKAIEVIRALRASGE